MPLLSSEEPNRGGGGQSHVRTPMAAQDIPRGQQELRAGAGAGLWFFASICPALAKDLRRNGLVRVQFPRMAPTPSWSRPMSPAAARHVPVLGREASDQLSPHAGGVYLDATFGGGGYSRMILDVPGTRVIGIDRDRSAIAGGFDLVERSDGRLTLIEDRFSRLEAAC